MKIKQATFLVSSPNLKLCPNLNLPEFALLGRSNVGKSTFINTIVNNSKLAKTSNTPGKTRFINLFEIKTTGQDFIFADLPGYGFAKVSKVEQAKWQNNLEEYLLKRETLTSCIQFIDARHPIQKNDLQMHEWLVASNVPSFAILSKCDYISRNDIVKNCAHFEKLLGVEVLPFSSKNRIYVDNVLDKLQSLM